MARRLALAFITCAVLALTTLPAAANTITIGPQAMEGNLQVRPGDVVQAGISFTIPGSHPASTVQFVQPAVAFANVTCSSGSGGGSVTIALGSGGVLGPFSVPQNDSSFFPTGDQSSPSSYQGSVSMPDLCGGGTMSLSNGGTFSADVQSSDTTHSINVRFHYSANGSSGSWSATKSVFPDAVGGTPVPVGTLGILGLSVVVALGLPLVWRRTTTRSPEKAVVPVR